MSTPTKQVVLFEGTSAADTAFNTGTLNTTGYDAVFVEEQPSGAAAAASIYLKDMGKGSVSTTVGVIALSANADPNEIAWGIGVGTAAAAAYYRGGLSAPLPSSVRFDVGALGAGITCYLRVIGVRRHRGPDVSLTAD